KKHRSITLEADAKHLMTDVWTTLGVLIGVGLVALTGWQRLDPIIAILVAANIVWSGLSIVKKSVSGLMDRAVSIEDQNKIMSNLEPYKQQGIETAIPMMMPSNHSFKFIGGKNNKLHLNCTTVEKRSGQTHTFTLRILIK
ncbi:MAG: cation transporter, partial [Bacillota bacterium]|nr:cation transporter [Bacillota bacterium]